MPSPRTGLSFAAISFAVVSLAVAACDDTTIDAPKGDAGTSADAAVTDALPTDAGSDTGSANDAQATETSTEAGGGQRVSISFRAMVGTETFGCTKKFAGLGTQNTTVEFLDFRLFVHDVRLLKSGGGEEPVVLEQDGKWQYQNIALLDFEDKSGSCANGTTDTNTMVHGNVPPGTYSGIKFRLGVPVALNHNDVATAPSPLNLSGLFWNWNGGYKFLRADTRTVVDSGAPNVFNLHLGSTDCTAQDGGTTCGRPNRPEYTLAGFDAGKNAVVFDYKALIAGNDLSSDTGGAPGCMSGTTDPECGPLFPKLGLDLASGAPSAATQTFVRME